MDEKVIYGLGWLPDYPDFRDFTFETDKVTDKLKASGVRESVKGMLNKTATAKPVKALPTAVDLRPWCSTIENQLNLGSCTAHAGVGLIEYFEKRSFGKYIDASRLFLYKATRDLLHWTGDTGAFLRTTMGALVLCGVPPEEYWPYVVANYDIEPSAFAYALASDYKTIVYYRLDPPGTPTNVLLDRIKTWLASGLPSMFGFTVYNSIWQGNATGKIPYPTASDKIIGGHAIDAVGYDDSIKILNTNPGATETTGALLIRNSWGPSWGMAGYGWLPYNYVLNTLATDWWSLLKAEWVDTGVFK